MAETDRFLLEALRQSGGMPSSTEEIDIKSLTSAVFVSIVWRCLAKIQDEEPHLELGIPPSLDAPSGVAGRHRVGSQLANILKEIGFAGDCGYNHFLYPSEKETRSILSWLIGKLPSQSTRDRPSPGDYSTDHVAAPSTAIPAITDCLGDDQLAGVFSTWMNRKTLYVLPNRSLPKLRGFEKLPLRTAPVALPWLDQSPNKKMIFQAMPSGVSRTISLLESMAVAQRVGSLDVETLNAGEAEDASFGGRLDEVEERVLQEKRSIPDPQDADPLKSEFDSDPVMPPFFLSAANVLRENQLAHEHSNQASADSEAALCSASDEPSETTDAHIEDEGGNGQFETIHGRLLETQQKIELLREELANDQTELLAIQRRVDETRARGVGLKKELNAKRQLLALLPQAQESITKLEGICAKNDVKMSELATEWEAHTRPLVEEEQALLSMKSNRKARCRQFISEMKSFRTEMKEMAAAIQDKMETTRVLEKILASLPQNINRSSYTNRIMDIIKQVHKQKQEISKILDDIKAIQKQLNGSSEKLKRSEAVAEEKLYGEASKQASSNSSSYFKDTSSPAIEVYRKFAEVRELFEELIAVVSDVGKKENAARDLENWITQLHGRDSSAQLDKVLMDLQSVRGENAVLNDQLRALRT